MNATKKLYFVALLFLGGFILKDRAYKISRSFFCICSCCVILLLCICPALAADVGLSGAYTFNDQLYQPVGWTEQNVYFLSGDTYYLKITYEPMNDAYGVPVLYFGSTRVYLFAGQNTPGQWLPSASQIVDFGSLQQPVSDLFFAWLSRNATSGVSDPDYDAAGDIKTEVDSAISDLGGVADAYDQLPKLEIDVDSLVPDQFAGQAYIHLSSIISRFWDNPLLLVYSSVLGGIMVISFLLFASK